LHVNDQKSTIPRSLGKSKIATGSLREIKIIILGGQVSKNLHQEIFAQDVPPASSLHASEAIEMFLI